jgi:hypothetical protein
MVKDVAQVQVGVDQPVGLRATTKLGQHRLDPVGDLAKQPPGGRVDPLAGEPGGLRGAGQGQPPDVQPRPGKAPRWAEPAGVGVQHGQDPAQVGDQPPRRARLAVATPDPFEPDAAPTGRQLRAGHMGAEPGGGDGQVGLAGQGAQPAQLGVQLGVAAPAGRHTRTTSRSPAAVSQRNR